MRYGAYQTSLTALEGAWKLSNEHPGYHRELSGHLRVVRWGTDRQAAAVGPAGGCSVAIQVLLPQGIFIDNFQLQQLSNFGELPSNVTVFDR